MRVIIVASLLLTVLCEKLFLEKNLATSISGVYIQPSMLSKIDLLFCIDPHNSLKGQFQSMILDLTSDQVIVPNRSTGAGAFGIDCNTDTSCEPSSNSTVCSYRGLSFGCANSTTLLRFQEQSIPQPFEYVGFQFWLGDLRSSWQSSQGQNGILGLGPNSTFWPYIINQFKLPDNGKILTGISYKVKSQDQLLNESTVELTSSFVIMNGRYSSTPVFLAPLSESSGLWSISNVEIDLSSNLSLASASLCIDNTIGKYLLFEPDMYFRVLANFNLQLCGKRSGCTYANSNIPDVGSFKLRFTDSNPAFIVTLEADELVRFDKQGQPIYGFSDWENSDCRRVAGDKVVAAGRWVFTKAELLIEVDKNLAFRVGFSALFDEFKGRSVLIIILVSMLSFFLLGIIVIFAFNFAPQLCKKKDHYTKPADAQKTS